MKLPLSRPKKSMETRIAAPLRCRRMRVILALLAVEIALGIASSARRRRIAAVLRHETLHAGPSLDQRTIDREVLARHQLTDLRQVQHGDHELARYIATEKPVPILAEYRDRIVRREANKPT